MKAEKLWMKYINKYPNNKDKTYEAWYFGNNEKMANELAELVVGGEKTATTSGLCFYELDNEELPKEGEFNIILDWDNNAKCITKTTKVYTIPFNKVTKEHAFKEGEGDKTLSYWRKVHIEFFKQELKKYEKEFNENMIVVCEEFEVVWK
ncbi:ASCH domain-containing protein [Haloimpatiens sp. FM7330]|uniref:ASCH domain-containing protein n=1 Tax=Haloimpatiens sp. FM7330 TaxID=3298610 RepID=UPI00363BD031